MPQIHVKNLVKTYQVAKRRAGTFGAFTSLFKREHKLVKALDNVSFSIEPGELIGYIGPNGAGKSTSVKILSGIMVPDSGEVQVLGRTPWMSRIETVKEIGVVFGQRTQLWWDLPVIESFELLKDIYAIPEQEYKASRDRLIGQLSLEEFLDTPVRQLSLGQRMRCDLAASLLHSPSLLFLDEPTIGLDAISKLAVRNFIKEINKERQTTVILTTHDMDDIEALCQRVMIIGGGKILSDGSLEQLRKKFGAARRLTIDLEEEVADFHDPSLDVVSKEGHRLCLNFDPEVTGVPQIIQQISERYSIQDLFVENTPIEEIIADFYSNHTGKRQI